MINDLGIRRYCRLIRGVRFSVFIIITINELFR